MVKRAQVSRSSRAALFSGLSPDQAPLVSQLALGHLAHEPLEFVIGETRAHIAETPGNLFANFFLAEGVEFGDPELGVDSLC